MNVLLIMHDALRAGLGKRTGPMPGLCPTLDSMAHEGMSFGNAYFTMPLCVPGRISLLAGRWPDAHRVRMNLDAKDSVFTKDIYQVARERGYRTGLAGKDHTYLDASAADFWREYGHEGGHRSPGASSEVGDFEKWLKGLDMGISS
ncbi:MAG: sulfatase-like hydrolase/transferase [Edaphobacter sp.]